VTQRAPSGGAWLLGATAVAGGIGYVMQLLAGYHLEAAEYERFGVFWAAMFFVAGTLSGVQQEIARAAHPGGPRRSSPLRVGLVLCAIAVLLAVAVASAAPSLAVEALVIGVGAVGGVTLAIASGVSYGARAWSTVAAIMVVEAAIRLAMLETALLLDAPFWAVMLAIALPWGLSAALLGPRIRERAADVALDVRAPQLAANLARTVLGAAATSAIVSGFPFFMRASAPDAEAASFGAFAFAFTLTRAPLVVVFIALQSFLIKLFQEHRSAVSRRLLGLLGGLVAVTLVAAAIIAAAGPWAQRTFFGEDYVLASTTLFWIVASAAPLAVMCVTGPLALAMERHGAFVTGWVIAAGVSLALLALPLPLEVASIVAIAAGPAVGAVAHVLGIARQP
jgi:O-antigen/teichoic acid export membrane protein